MNQNLEWRVCSHTRRGLSHAEMYKESQDSLNYFEGKGYQVAVLADGVGSLPNSRLAADTATSETLEWFRKNAKKLETIRNPEPVLRDLFPYLRKRILDEAAAEGAPSNSLDCNLAFVCIFNNANKVLFGALGDCAVCIFSGEKNSVITDTTSVGGGTYTVLDPDARDRVLLGTVIDLDKNPVHGFLLTTDGLENAVYLKQSTLPLKTAEPFINAACTGTGNERLKKLIDTLPDSFADDISIIVLSRAAGPVTLPDDPQWLCTCGHHNSLRTNICSECGANFLTLYEKVAFPSDTYGFFRELNQDPERERQLLHMPAAEAHDTPKAPETPAAQEEPAEPEPPKKEEEKPAAPERTGHQRSQEQSSIHRAAASKPASPTGTHSTVGLGSDLHRIKRTDKTEQEPHQTTPADPDDPEDQPTRKPAGKNTGKNSGKNTGKNTGKSTVVPAADKTGETDERELPVQQSQTRPTVPAFPAVAAMIAIVLLAAALFFAHYRINDLTQRLEQVESILNIGGSAHTAAPTEADAVYYTVSTPIAAVRDEPHPDGDELFKLRLGTVVEMIGGPATDLNGDKWVRIRTADTEEGWCLLMHLE